MIDKFINYMKNNGVSENTYKSYASDIKLFQIYYEDSYGESLNKLIHTDISMYSNFLLKRNYSPKTINRKISAISMYNHFLVNEKIQDDLVVVPKDYIKVQQTMVAKTLPSDKEINKLKHFACRDEKNAKRDYCFMALLLYSGIRESELVSIRLIDIKLEDRYINIIGKGNKFRQVMINNSMYDALKEYLEERTSINTQNPYLFIGQKNINTNSPYNRNFCNRLLNKYKELCNIDNLHPHLLRSFFCTNALHNAGYSIEQVANQAGHSSLNTTKGYLVTNQYNLLTLANNL